MLQFLPESAQLNIMKLNIIIGYIKSYPISLFNWLKKIWVFSLIIILPNIIFAGLITNKSDFIKNVTVKENRTRIYDATYIFRYLFEYLSEDNSLLLTDFGNFLYSNYLIIDTTLAKNSLDVLEQEKKIEKRIIVCENCQFFITDITLKERQLIPYNRLVFN